MNLLCDRPLLRIALIGALAASLGLTACGRKGPLDPPPGASLAGDQAAPAGDARYGSAVMGPDGKPLAPAGPNKRIPLDVLLN
ncbi:MAG TPA: lipoprotein [Pseudolabrys sp.]